ncbi:unnamed protein product [Albugo candida]|uniref:Uncharacterized protein n=1 Tax=Albugo candida TaxID=65357 RepID=A0A024GM36_9STRA|nr:unnamed protein product [Albugo candida]|eukprot:CCI47596.1 unnamed protein product [Albugo candida]
MYTYCGEKNAFFNGYQVAETVEDILTCSIRCLFLSVKESTKVCGMSHEAKEFAADSRCVRKEENRILSPDVRIRKRLNSAKEHAHLFGFVCDQGEVVQWMSACHSDLIPLGQTLEQKGFTTLSSIAFLTEGDIDPDIDANIRRMLMMRLSRLRHEIYRM